jgi:hypothetical protein
VNVRPEFAEGGQTVVTPRTTKLVGSYELTPEESDRVKSGEYLNGEAIAQVVTDNFSKDTIQSTAKAAVQEVLSEAKDT